MMDSVQADPTEGTGSAACAGELGGVTAVIVNWETPGYTIRAARALLADGLTRGQLVIVDNGSKDGSYEEITRTLPGCVAIRLEENIGYARAANIGARAQPTESYLFVNNDAFVHRAGSVPAMVRAESADPESMAALMEHALGPELLP
jgi:GT2 family glycosyltransferase